MYFWLLLFWERSAKRTRENGAGSPSAGAAVMGAGAARASGREGGGRAGWRVGAGGGIESAHGACAGPARHPGERVRGWGCG